MALRTPWSPMRLGKMMKRSSKAWLQAMSFSCRSGTPKANWKIKVEGEGPASLQQPLNIYCNTHRNMSSSLFHEMSPDDLIEGPVPVPAGFLHWRAGRLQILRGQRLAKGRPWELRHPSEYLRPSARDLGKNTRADVVQVIPHWLWIQLWTTQRKWFTRKTRLQRSVLGKLQWANISCSEITSTLTYNYLKAGLQKNRITTKSFSISIIRNWKCSLWDVLGWWQKALLLQTKIVNWWTKMKHWKSDGLLKWN